MRWIPTPEPGHAWRRALAVPLSGLVALALAGCPQDDDDSATGDDDDTASVIENLEVDVSEVIGTVVALRWSTATETEGRVEFGPTADHGRRVQDPAGASLTHEVTLLGLVADTEYHFRVVATEGGGEIGGSEGTFLTGPLPAELVGVELQIDAPDPEEAHNGFLAVPLISQVSIPTIIDGAGNPVWWHIDESPHETITTVHLTADRSAVIYNSFHMAGDGDDDGENPEKILKVSLDGRTVERIEAARHTHDFAELPDGTLAYIAEDRRDFDGELVRGDKIVELSPDGSEVDAWSVWDHFEYDPDQEPQAGTGYTHANALDYLPDENAYYVSLRSQGCIVKIDRASGQVVWTLGSYLSDFEFVGSHPISDQHQFHVLDDNVLIFDNGYVEDLASRAVEWSLDLGGGTADLAWSYYTDPVLYIISGGDVTRLPSGNTLITWSSAGQIDEVDPNGDLVWQLATFVGYGVGFSEWIEDIDAR